MLNAAKKFHALPWRMRAYFVQAYFLLGMMRAAILVFSFKRLSRSLKHHAASATHTPLTDQQQQRALEIGEMVATAARFTPWKSNCLTQALTAQKMLRWRHIPGMFFLGVKKNQKQLEAHAWLQCDQHILTGKAGHEVYTVVSSFSWL